MRQKSPYNQSELTRDKGNSPLIWTLFGLILTLSLILRLHNLSYTGLWYDEAHGLLFAAEPLSEIPRILSRDASPPLYYVIMHWWMGTFGMEDHVVRLFSVLTGLLLITAIFFWAKRFFSPWVGLLAMLILAISPIQVFHSQQARMYALLPLVALLSVHFLSKYLQKRDRKDLVLFALFAVLALYTHNFAFHLAPVYATMILLSGQFKGRGILLWLGTATVIALAYLPWLPHFITQLTAPSQYDWLVGHGKFLDWGFFDPAMESIRSFSPAGEASTFGEHNTEVLGRWPSLVCLLLALTAITLQIKRTVSRGDRLGLTPVIYLVVPIGSALISSFFVPANLVPGRVDQLYFPAFALLVAIGIMTLPKVWIRLGIAMLLLSIGLYTHPRFTLDPMEVKGLMGTEREAADAILAKYVPGDILLSMGYGQRTIKYYMHAKGVRPTVVTFLEARPEGKPGILQKDEFKARWHAALERLIKRELKPGGKIFLIGAGGKKSTPLFQGLLERKRVALIGEIGKYLLWGFHKGRILYLASWEGEPK